MIKNVDYKVDRRRVKLKNEVYIVLKELIISEYLKYNRIIKRDLSKEIVSEIEKLIMVINNSNKDITK